MSGFFFIPIVVPSGENTSRKKYFESRKRPTNFDALIPEEHFGQISMKSGKSTYPINSFEYGEFTQKQKRKSIQHYYYRKAIFL